MIRIGFYPGTFDPLHDGHTAFMREAAACAGLDTIYIMPESKPRHKPHASPVSKRIDDISRRIAVSPKLQLLSPSTDKFTIGSTLPEMTNIAADNEKYLLMGSDTLLGLHKWNDVASLLQSYHLIIGMRHTQTDKEVNKILQILVSQYNIKHHIIKTNYGHISSRDIRNQKKTLSI